METMYATDVQHAIDTVAMRELSVDHRPQFTIVTGLVSDEQTPFSWFESVRYSGYYCDEEDCPDDEYTECGLHPGVEYWRDAMRADWLVDIRGRGMRPVVDPDLVKEQLGIK